MKKKKKQKWIKFRHRPVRAVLNVTLGVYSKWKYGITVEKFRQQGDRPYLILYNHQTAFDQFFVGMSFRGPVYYVASEDLFSKGWVSSLIRFLVAPIPIKKQTTDIGAVMNCIRVAREGGTIAIAPEGNRTYSGKTEYMSSAIAPLAKKLKLPIAFYRIEGGYGVHPRWSDKVRKGKMRSYVSAVLEPEELAAMTNDELYERIQQELFVDEGVADAIFRSAHRAEYLERAMYVCPFCGLSEFESNQDRITCKKCGKTVAYGEDKTLTGVDCEFPFQFTTQWYDYQKDFVNKLDVTQFTAQPLYRDTSSLSEVLLYKKKVSLRKSADVALYGDRIVIDEGKENEMVLPFSELVALSVLGKNKLNIYYGDHLYQLKSHKRFNALKYVNIYFRYKNITRGEADGTFLGL